MTTEALASRTEQEPRQNGLELPERVAGLLTQASVKRFFPHSTQDKKADFKQRVGEILADNTGENYYNLLAALYAKELRYQANSPEGFRLWLTFPRDSVSPDLPREPLEAIGKLTELGAEILQDSGQQAEVEEYYLTIIDSYESHAKVQDLGSTALLQIE